MKSSECSVIESPPADSDEKKFTRHFLLKRVLRIFLLIAIVWPPIAWFGARGLIVHEDVAQSDAIVVLGGSSTFVERTQFAAEIFKERHASNILLTNDGQQGGWSDADKRNPLFVERAVRELVASGVSADKIDALPQIVTSTYEEAVLLRQYAEIHGLRSILIVTSAYHSRRALWSLRTVFEGSGIEIGITSPPTGLQTPPPATWWLHVTGWQLVGGEYVKLLYYHLRY